MQIYYLFFIISMIEIIRRPPNLSELTPCWISLGLTQLGSEVSKFRIIDKITSWIIMKLNKILFTKIYKIFHRYTNWIVDYSMFTTIKSNDFNPSIKDIKIIYRCNLIKKCLQILYENEFFLLGPIHMSVITSLIILCLVGSLNF